MPSEVCDNSFDELYAAIKQGAASRIAGYLQGGGSPNLQNRNGWTLLMAAAFKGSSRILTLLLASGADVDTLNNVGESALAVAAGSGHHKCVRILLQHGASVQIHPLGWSFADYMSVAKHPSPEVTRLLQDAGAL